MLYFGPADDLPLIAIEEVNLKTLWNKKNFCVVRAQSSNHRTRPLGLTSVTVELKSIELKNPIPLSPSPLARGIHLAWYYTKYGNLSSYKDWFCKLDSITNCVSENNQTYVLQKFSLNCISIPAKIVFARQNSLVLPKPCIHCVSL